MSLKGRRALVTGAAGKIGGVIAETLAELGAGLVLVDRASADFGPVRSALAGVAGVEIVHCDLEVPDERNRLVESIGQAQGGLHVLVNNAAFVGSSDLAGWSGSLGEQTTDTWRRALEVNLTAAFDLCRGLAPVLGRCRGASIVNIASIYGFCGPDMRLYEGTAMGNPAAYAASKGGLIQLSRWLATTLAPSVRVNCLSPGGVARGQPDSFVARYVARTPLGRMATEDDLRGALAFLASDLSAYCTGQNLVVDGGWSAW